MQSLATKRLNEWAEEFERPEVYMTFGFEKNPKVEQIQRVLRGEREPDVTLEEEIMRWYKCRCEYSWRKVGEEFGFDEICEPGAQCHMGCVFWDKGCKF